jgi:hypothetical protein
MPSMDETMSEVFDLANEDADEGDGRPDESQGEEVKEEPETEEKPEGDPKTAILSPSPPLLVGRMRTRRLLRPSHAMRKLLCQSARAREKRPLLKKPKK